MAEAWESEERDDHGRFSGGGGGAGAGGKSVTEERRYSKDELAETNHAVEIAPKGFTNTGTLGATTANEMQKAVDDATARHPELVEGEHPLTSVQFSSSIRGGGDELRNELGPNQAVTEGDVSANMRIIVNDEVPFRPNLSSQLQNGYGTMTHELGHAYFLSHGIDGDTRAGIVLDKYEISPGEAAQATGSKYAASSPQEALAEMYGVAHTPGADFKVPAVGERYAEEEAAVGTLAFNAPRPGA